MYIDDSGVCQICKTLFLPPHRVIANVSDKRRTKCRAQTLTGHCEPLSDDLFLSLQKSVAKLFKRNPENGFNAYYGSWLSIGASR